MRGLHSADPQCAICTHPEGLRMVSAHEFGDHVPPALHNEHDITGNGQWFHGTNYDPKMGDLKTADERGEDHSGWRHWNTHLGTHFTSQYMTAKQFATREFDPVHARIAHASLHMEAPMHYHSEHQMTDDAFRWARKNGFKDYDQHTDGQTGERSVKEYDESPDDHKWLNKDMLSRSGDAEGWLQGHPRIGELAHGFKKSLQDLGFDGITYGNEHEKPYGHTSAIAFKETPVKIHEWEKIHAPADRRATASADVGYHVSNANNHESIMDFGLHGDEPRDWGVGTRRKGISLSPTPHDAQHWAQQSELWEDRNDEHPRAWGPGSKYHVYEVNLAGLRKSRKTVDTGHEEIRVHEPISPDRIKHIRTLSQDEIWQQQKQAVAYSGNHVFRHHPPHGDRSFRNVHTLEAWAPEHAESEWAVASPHDREPYHGSFLDPGHRPMGSVSWDKDTGEIKGIHSVERRQGLATEMLRRAREIAATHSGVPSPVHSDFRTESGDAWATSTGDNLPARKAMGHAGPDYDNLKFKKVVDNEEEDDPKAARASGDYAIHAIHPEHGVVGKLTYADMEHPDWTGYPARALHINMLRVHQDHRRRGVATQLMKHLEDTHPDVPIDHGTRTRMGEAWGRNLYGRESKPSTNFMHGMGWDDEANKMTPTHYEADWTLNGKPWNVKTKKFLRPQKQKVTAVGEGTWRHGLMPLDKFRRLNSTDQGFPVPGLRDALRQEWATKHDDARWSGEDTSSEETMVGDHGIHDADWAHGGPDNYIDHLKRSIKQHGLREPLELGPGDDPDDQHLNLHDGNHRAAAVHELGIDPVPVKWHSKHDHLAHNDGLEVRHATLIKQAELPTPHSRDELIAHAEGKQTLYKPVGEEHDRAFGDGLCGAHAAQLEKERQTQFRDLGVHRLDEGEKTEHRWNSVGRGSCGTCTRNQNEWRNKLPGQYGAPLDGPRMSPERRPRTFNPERQVPFDPNMFHGLASKNASDDYQGNHRPGGPSEEEGDAPAHQVDKTFPDFYEKPHLYDHHGSGGLFGGARTYPQTVQTLRRVRGNPEAPVTMYRSLPPEHAHKGFNTGDWVSIHPDYARGHGLHETDEKEDWPVIKATVPAKHLWNNGDMIDEFGYHGPAVKGEIHFPGGENAAKRLRKEGRFTPDKRVFTSTCGLDHRLFEKGGHLKTDVRKYIMSSIAQMWGSKYPTWSQWAIVYFAGSEASEWTSPELEGNNDFDVLIGVDYEHFLHSNPAYRSMSTDDITREMNRGFHAFNGPVTLTVDGHKYGPFDRTTYVNPDSYDIRKIKPYAAYNVSSDEWTVKPPHLPHWSLSELPRAVQQVLRAASNYAHHVLSLPEPERTQQGAALFDSWHSDRSRAFSDKGEGWWDIANLREKWLDQEGIWSEIVGCKHRAKEGLDAAPVDWSNMPKFSAASGFSGHNQFLERLDKGPEEEPYLHGRRDEYAKDVTTHTGHNYTLMTGTHIGFGGNTQVTAHRRLSNGKYQGAGYLSWFGGNPDKEGRDGNTSPGTIYKVHVAEQHRRRGLASAMLDFARERYPEMDIRHSTALTEDGRSWAEKKASNPNVPYYHATHARLKPGDQLQTATARGHNADHHGPEEAWRNDRVWMTKTPALAHRWAEDQGKTPHVYEVRPTNDVKRHSPEPYDQTEFDAGGGQYHAAGAEIVRKVPLEEYAHKLRRWASRATDAVTEVGKREHPNVDHYASGGMGHIEGDESRSVVGFMPTEKLFGYEGNPTHDREVVRRVSDDIKSGKGITNPLMMIYDHKNRWAYLGEGNHRLEGATEAGARTVPVRFVRGNAEYEKSQGIGRPMHLGESPWKGGMGEDYIPTDIHPHHFLKTSTVMTENRHWGAGLDSLFPHDEDGPKSSAMTPWAAAGQSKERKSYDEDLVARSITHPHEFPVEDVDPRDLRATQPKVIRAGVQHYMNNQSGKTYGEDNGGDRRLGNDMPRIYHREDGQKIILSGHHRAAAALLKGEPLRAIVVRGPWGAARRAA